jgi:hypothetical protein
MPGAGARGSGLEHRLGWRFEYVQVQIDGLEALVEEKDGHLLIFKRNIPN